MCLTRYLGPIDLGLKLATFPPSKLLTVLSSIDIVEEHEIMVSA